MDASQSTPDSTFDPWYAAGLQFSCTQCGNCCTGSPGYVWVDAAEIQAIADYLQVPRGEVEHLKTKLVGAKRSLKEHANGDCIYLDGKTRKCSIYPVRPKQCRTWPFWNSNLESEGNWKQVQAFCPGAGQGDFFSLEQIRQRAAEIDL